MFEKEAALVLLILIIAVFSFFIGYGVGISDPEPKETRELEKQIKLEELKNIQLENKIREMGLENDKF